MGLDFTVSVVKISMEVMGLEFIISVIKPQPKLWIVSKTNRLVINPCCHLNTINRFFDYSIKFTSNTPIFSQFQSHLVAFTKRNVSTED